MALRLPSALATPQVPVFQQPQLQAASYFGAPNVPSAPAAGPTQSALPSYLTAPPTSPYMPTIGYGGDPQRLKDEILASIFGSRLTAPAPAPAPATPAPSAPPVAAPSKPVAPALTVPPKEPVGHYVSNDRNAGNFGQQVAYYGTPTPRVSEEVYQRQHENAQGLWNKLNPGLGKNAGLSGGVVPVKKYPWMNPRYGR